MEVAGLTLSPFFFPEASTKLLVAMCYLITVVTAFKRFSNLAVGYETFDAPEKARPWTTFLRFYSAGVIYVCVYAVAFAILYLFFRQYPEFIDIAQSAFEKDPIAEAILPKIKDMPHYTYPIIATLTLTVGFYKIKPLAALEQDIRSFFQRIGSIPKQISRTTSLMQRSNIKFDENECMASLSDEIKMELNQHLKQNDEKSFERLYLRARHLHQALLGWNNKLSPYYYFRTIYPTQFDNVSKAFSRIDEDIKRYFNTLLEFRNTFERLKKSSLDEESLVKAAGMFAPLRKNRAELRESLKNIIENMYTLIASAILSEGISEGARIRRLKAIGFYIPRRNMDRLSFADPNDMALLALLLFLVVPVASLFSRSLQSNTLSIFVIWPAIAIWIGLAGVIPVAFFKKRLETSRNDFWAWLRNDNSQYTPLAYILAACIAFIGGAIGMTLLLQLDPGINDESRSIWAFVPWATIAIAITVSTGINYDRIKINSDAAHLHSNAIRMGDVFITALLTVAAAIFALLISSEAFETAVLLKKEEFRFIVPAAALLGGIIGAVIPERYRRHKAQQLILKRQPIDLACIINECQNTLAQRLNQSRITLNIQSSAEKAMVDVDPCRIQQVFMGLLTNALEYSHPEHTIGISWEHGRNTDTVQVAIADSGTGISQNKLLEIRESFEQQDTQWLYFINNDIPADLNQIHFILTLHNGTIEMERNEAGGTTVRISLPAAKQSAERITELAPDLQATSDTDEAAKKEEPVVMIS